MRKILLAAALCFSIDGLAQSIDTVKFNPPIKIGNDSLIYITANVACLYDDTSFVVNYGVFGRANHLITQGNIPAHTPYGNIPAYPLNLYNRWMEYDNTVTTPAQFVGYYLGFTVQ
jgi:hypothetical protein